MTKRLLIVFALAALVAAAATVFAVNYVPSPFATVKLRGDTIVATLQSGLSFAMLRPNDAMVKHIDSSEPLELQDGQSVRLRSAQRSYVITCRTSTSPPGLDVEGEWHLHDFPKSAVKKWFIGAH